MREVEQAGARACMEVLSDDAFVLDRHQPAGKRNHPSAQCSMNRRQGRFEKTDSVLHGQGYIRKLTLRSFSGPATRRILTQRAPKCKRGNAMATILPITQEERALKAKIAQSCRIIGKQGVTRGSFGHVSARLPGTDRILIKSKGPDEEALEFASAHDIISIDMVGKVLDAPDGLTAPQETAMHLAVYRRRPEVQSVIHSHPDWVVVLTAVEKPLVPIIAAYDGGSALRMVVQD